MSLFSFQSKKPESIKKLSEKDIQEKLYGRYRGYHRSDKPSSPAVRGSAEKQGISSGQSLEEAAREDLFAGPRQQLEQEEPEVLEPKDEAASLETVQAHRNPASEKIAQWVKNENRQVAAAAGTKTQPRRYDRVAPKIQKPNVFGIVLERGLSMLQTAVRSSVYFIQRVFQVVDLKNPFVRTVFYWAGAVSFIVLLFFGIHVLNINRESAMKNPPRSKAKSVAVDAAVKDAAKKSRQQQSVKSVNQAASAVPAALAPSSGSDGTTLPKAQPENQNLSETQSDAEAQPHPYVVQVATYVNRQDAERALTKIQMAGVPSFIRPVRHTDGRSFYSVFLGRFSSYHEAQTALGSFKQSEASRPFSDAFIRTLK